MFRWRFGLKDCDWKPRVLVRCIACRYTSTACSLHPWEGQTNIWCWLSHDNGETRGSVTFWWPDSRELLANMSLLVITRKSIIIETIASIVSTCQFARDFVKWSSLKSTVRADELLNTLVVSKAEFIAARTSRLCIQISLSQPHTIYWKDPYHARISKRYESRQQFQRNI
jgi:hypothetical protein